MINLKVFFLLLSILLDIKLGAHWCDWNRQIPAITDAFIYKVAGTRVCKVNIKEIIQRSTHSLLLIPAYKCKSAQRWIS